MILWLIPILPLVGATINGLFGRRFSNRTVSAIGLLFPGLAMLYTWWIAAQFFPNPGTIIQTYGLPWIKVGSFTVEYGFQLDQLSMLMALIVTGVGFLIHVYSVGYMAHEGGYYRFFSYLNLFMFFMLTLVLANNYLLMFVGWEGVGLASYLLIGFYFLRDSASAAGKKAFIVNRIGDFGFLIALFLIIQHFGTVNFSEVFAKANGMPVETAGAGLLTAIGLLFLLGATGKSAQIPLYVWLPDAMEGPTPVSALIHAATMVTAGVYMISRSNVIFNHAPIALSAVAVIGCATAFFAATIGLVQHDIKRVLAYSTVSQLGYMVMACGVAAYSAGMFHLMTHAFFKALLFLGAGSVIHALGGEQDMRKMGGLRKYIPVTFWTMTAATLAISGFPGFAGFFSKDEILTRAYAHGPNGWILWLIGTVTAFLTAFYMFRLWFLTFFGEYRGGAGHDQHAGREEHHGHAPHESPKVMLLPLVILAILSVIGGWVGVSKAWGGSNHFEHYLAPIFEHEAAAPESAAVSPDIELTSAQELKLSLDVTVAALAGIGLAWFFYYKRRDLPEKLAARLHGLYVLIENKYFVDEFYGAAIVKPLILGSTYLLWKGIDVGVIDRTINDSADAARDVSRGFRQMQSGNIRSYAGWVAAGAAAVVVFMIWKGTR